LKKYKNVEFLFIAVCELDLLITQCDDFLFFELLYMFTEFYFKFFFYLWKRGSG